MGQDNPPVAPGSQGKAPETRVGHAGWDYKDAFWGQWERVLAIRSGGEGDLTGAVESLASLARMAADDQFLADWKNRPVHQVQGVWVPTIQDNQAAIDVVADMVRRKGWAEKRRLISVVRPWTMPSAPGLKPELKNGVEG